MSVASLTAWCQSKMGRPYSTAYSRFGYSAPEHYDCSGFVWRGCNDHGFPFSASVSWTMQLEAERKGLTVSKEYAMRHVAVAIHGGNTAAGGGPNGHIAITDGGGGTWEAMGTRYGCRKGTIGNRFEYFCRLPGYVPPAPVGPTPEQVRAELQRRARIAAEVRRRTAVRAELDRRTLDAMEEDDMQNVAVLKYAYMDNIFTREGRPAAGAANVGKLAQMWWDAPHGVWQTSYPNDQAGHPEILVAEGGFITGRTNALHHTTNPIDLYYPAADGTTGHTWWTGSSWGAQTLWVGVPA